jgi:hypothetical protein
MATPNTMKFGDGMFYLGTNDVTPVYTKLCGVTAWNISFSKETTDSSVPDCDDPDLPIWNQTDVTGQGVSISIEGFAVPEAQAMIETATLSTVSVPVRLYIKNAGSGGATPDKLYSLKAHITHEISGELKNRPVIKLTVTGDGPCTVSNAAIP